MPLPASDLDRKKALEKAYQELGYDLVSKNYDQSRLVAYNKRIKTKLNQQVNFGLNDEGGEDQADPPGIKEYPLWKVMKKIEKDAPEGTPEQLKQKVIAIGSIRALIYLRVNLEYAAELAFLYDVNMDIFHKFKLDQWNQAANNDLHMHGGWRSQEYKPFHKIKINPRLTNHLEYFVRSFTDKGKIIFPWTTEEIQKSLDTELVNIESVVSAMINEEYTQDKQAKFLQLFIDNIKISPTGCAAERLQGAIEALGREMQGNHSFNELLNHSAACQKLKKLIHSKDKNDLSKMAEVHLELFVELQGQTIVFANGTEIKVSPEKYIDIINEINKEFINCKVFTASSAPAFYQDPATSFINAIKLPECSNWQGNIGKLKFETRLEAEKAFLYSQYLIGKEYPEFAKKSQVIQSSLGDGFEFSISAFQYATLTSLKDAPKPKLEKTPEEQIKDTIIAKLKEIKAQLGLAEGEYYTDIGFAEKKIGVSNMGGFCLTDSDGNSIDESGLIQNEEEEEEEEEINTLSKLQEMKSFIEVVEQNIEDIKVSINEKMKQKEEQTQKRNLIEKIQALYRIINDKAENLDPDANKFFNNVRLQKIEIALPGGANISVEGSFNDFTITYQEHSIRIEKGGASGIEEQELQFWLNFFKEIDEKSLSEFDPTNQLQAKLAQGTDDIETLLPVVSKETLLKNFFNMATPDEVCGGKQIPLNKIPQDQAVLLQNDKGELFVLNEEYVQQFLESTVKHNTVLKQLKSYQKQIEDLAVYFVKDQNNQYSYHGSRDINGSSIKEAIEFLCEILSDSVVPPTLDNVLVGLFNQHLDPIQNENEFKFLLSGLIARFAYEEEKTMQIKHPESQTVLTPVRTVDDEYLKSDNLVAIYLQCCAKANISLEDFHKEQQLIDEKLTIYQYEYQEKHPEKHPVDYVLKYEQDFAELSNGDHLKRFIEGDLKLSEIETQFLKRLGIEPVVKAKPKPVDAKDATTIDIPKSIEKSLDGKAAFPQQLQLNRINEYYVPFQFETQWVSPQEYADKMLGDIRSLLKQNPDLKIAITYAANNNESTGIYHSYQNASASYSDLENGGWHISGTGQAPAFAILQKTIFADQALKDKVHILPVTTVMHPVSNEPGNPFPGLTNEASKPHLELVKRDVENIAEHLGAGYMVLGLTNQESVKQDKFAIGGDNAPAWRKNPNSPGLVVDAIMSDLKQGQIANKPLNSEIICDVGAAFKKGSQKNAKTKKTKPTDVAEISDKQKAKKQLEDRINEFLEDIAEKYIKEMRVPRTLWGGDLEIGAISELLNLKIIVHKNGQEYTFGVDKTNEIHITYSGGHYDVCNEQGNVTWSALGDNDCLFHACIQAAILKNFPVDSADALDKESLNNDQSRLAVAEKLRSKVCDYLAEEKVRLRAEAEAMLEPGHPQHYRLQDPDDITERQNFIEKFVNNKNNYRIRQRFEMLINQTEAEANLHGDNALDLPSGSSLVQIAKELRAQKIALGEKPKKPLKKLTNPATLVDPSKPATLTVDHPIDPPIKKIGKVPSTTPLDLISTKFILNSIEEYFNLKETKERLPDIQYIKSTSQAVDFIGHFKSTTTQSILATIRQDSIACPVLQGKSTIIPEQQKILMEFLKFQSIQAKNKGKEPAIVVAENFSPKELEELLNSLNQDKTISQFIKLQLPEFKLCSYRNNIQYTQAEYDKLKVEIYKYNHEIFPDQKLSEEQLKNLDSTPKKKPISPS